MEVSQEERQTFVLLYCFVINLYYFVLLRISLYYFVLLFIALYCFVLRFITLFYFVLLCMALCFSVLLCITLYYFALLCFTLYFFVLLCIIMYYFVLLCKKSSKQSRRLSWSGGMTGRLLPKGAKSSFWNSLFLSISCVVIFWGGI